jgi:hypothetical protein
MKSILPLLAIAIGFNLNAQQINLDSLIGTKKTVLFEGIIPASVTHGYESKAKLWQSVIAEGKHYYEAKYKNITVNAKLAVLDSAHWTSEVVSYGYTFATQGWIVLPADIDFNDFVRIYGDISSKDEFLREAKIKGIKPDEIAESVFSVICIHELGHLIMTQMINDEFSDVLFNELAANIVAYEFFKNNKPELLKGFELFYNFHLNNYKPFYTTLNELYDNMGKMSVANYDWYESKFMKLVEEIYNYKEVDFLTSLKNICMESKDKNLGIKEIAILLDKDYKGLITTWLSKNNW